ncbi:MAG: hypothetical protein AAB392_01920 [Patescibacteria group bacterium]
MRSKFYLYFSIWIILLSYLGVPNIWKVHLTTASGILLLAHSLWPTILKRLQTKPLRPKKLKPETEKPLESPQNTGI